MLGIIDQSMLGGPEEWLGNDVVIYDGDPAGELTVLNGLSPSQILLYPKELAQTENPTGNERAEFERQSLR